MAVAAGRGLSSTRTVSGNDPLSGSAAQQRRPVKPRPSSMFVVGLHHSPSNSILRNSASSKHDNQPTTRSSTAKPMTLSSTRTNTTRTTKLSRPLSISGAPTNRSDSPAVRLNRQTSPLAKLRQDSNSSPTGSPLSAKLHQTNGAQIGSVRSKAQQRMSKTLEIFQPKFANLSPTPKAHHKVLSPSSIKPSIEKSSTLPKVSRLYPQLRKPTPQAKVNSTAQIGSEPDPQKKSTAINLKTDVSKSRLPRVAGVTTPVPRATKGSTDSDSTPKKITNSPQKVEPSGQVTNGLPSKLSQRVPLKKVSTSSKSTSSVNETQVYSTLPIDNDQTPKKVPRRIPRIKKQSGSASDPTDDQPTLVGPAKDGSGNVAIDIVVSSTNEPPDLRPLTRARSRLLGMRSSAQSLCDDHQSHDLPSKSSRVLALAQSFEDIKSSVSTVSATSSDASQANTSSKPSPSVLEKRESMSSLNFGLTPVRRNHGSDLSVASPSMSITDNSPNLSALASTLSKQHAQRQRLSGARTSVTDMLRYSTMSTLGALRWEDGAGDVLLTDVNETEAMVADISLTEMTPIRPEVESAAVALASARANFLSVVQENESLSPSLADLHGLLSQNEDRRMIEGQNRRRSKLESPLVDLSSRRRMISMNNHMRTPNLKDRRSSNSSLNQMMIHEAQLASLTAELERSREIENELREKLEGKEEEIKEEEEEEEEEEEAVVKEEDRERLLIEEMKRLESEIEERSEINVKLENELDLMRYENEELKIKQERMIESFLTKSDKMMIEVNNNNDDDKGKEDEKEIKSEIKKYESNLNLIRLNCIEDLKTIKSYLNMIEIIKLGLELHCSLDFITK